MWGIVAVYFITLIVVGILTSRLVKNSGQYYLGGKQFGPVFTAFRFASTFESGAMMVGTPGMAYASGMPAFLQGFLSPLGYFFAFRVFGQRLKVACDHFNTITVPQLLEKRYDSRTVRVLGSIAILIGLIGSVTAQLKAMGEVFAMLLNIPYMYAVLIGVLVVGIYSICGGYLATAWANFIQGVIMLVGAIVLFSYTSMAAFGKVGGFDFPARLNAEIAKVNPDMLTITGGGQVPVLLIIVFIFIALTVGLAMPQQVVTLFSMRDVRVARISLVICSFFSVILLWSLLPSAMMAHIILPAVDNPDRVIPALVSSVLPVWLGGIFIAAILSAIMSTVGSIILVAASALSQDIFSIVAPQVYEKHPVLYDRIAVALMVIIPLLVALKPPAIIFWIILFSFGMIVVTFLMPMFGTIFWKRATKHGAIAGMLVGMILVPLWAILGDPVIPGLLLGLIAGPLAFIIGSLVTQPPKEIVEPLWEAYSQI